ncbi:hypothetical protein QYE76_030460 [Lolium multiflorum]|uniref:Transposase (putative) gypsy type domain-containing protein n=1 Tax=Lolium multiflorum TaxID=4521 RepID=A0AAD8QQE8_LOLMU|nr:hypothetical protein QYE76_030460 [Lolium multiflorum]
MAAEDLEWERSKISNQDMNLLKKLGFTKKEHALRFPKEESYPSPPIEYRVSFVDHLIRGLSPPIHEFLRGLLFVYGLQLHQLTPNSILHVSILITLCECFLGVQPNWALWKRIFCLRRNGSHNIAYNIGGVVICVCSDVEYFDVKFRPGVAEKMALSYFLRIRVQPLQARKNPLWMYAGEEDVDRLSKDLQVKDLEKLIRRISSLNKKDAIPSSCRVEPYSGTNALPENHPVLASLPPLPEGGEVEERTVVTDDNQGASRLESEVAGSHKSAASSEKEAESEATASTHSPSSAVSPRNKRKRGEIADSGTSKTGASHAEEVIPDAGKKTFDPYEDALVSSGDKDENPPIDTTARTSTSRTLVVSEAQPDGDETSPPQQDTEHPTPIASPRASSPKRARVDPAKEPTMLIGCSTTPLMEEPFMKELIRLGTQFVGYRDYAAKLEETLAESNKRADALAVKLEQSEKARKKAEADAAAVEDLRKRLHDTETSLSDNISHQSAREKEILTRLESQSRRFVRKTQQDYELESPEGDPLLDALSLLEIHGDEAREGLAEARTGLSRLFPYFFKKKEAPTTFTALAKCFNSQEDLGLQLRQEGLKVGVEGTIALVADSQQEVDWARVGNTGEMETKRWQSLIKAGKPNSKKILAYLGYKQTPAPSSSKPECLAKMAKRKRNVGKIDDIVTPVAEEMMDELLRMDAEFFVKGSYAEHSTRATNNERLTIDDILGSE